MIYEKEYNDLSAENNECKQNAELDKAIESNLPDLKEGRFVIESVKDHMRRIKKLI